MIRKKRILLKVLIGFIVFISVLVLISIQKINRDDYQHQPFYKKWKKEIKAASIKPEINEESIKAGWAKVNITPKTPAPLAGYGKRKGANYDLVHDSIYVRTIALSLNNKTVYLLNADLLIVPPNITEKFNRRLKKQGIDPQSVHISATHSHNSLGGWGQNLTGKLFAGTYNPETENILADQFVQAIKNAKLNLSEAKISYGEIEDSVHIKNRLINVIGIEDPEIRSLLIEKNNGQKAKLITYGAHATVLNSSTLSLSRDYPGVLLDNIEKDNSVFGMFMAGAVGSMGPIEVGNSDFDEVNNQGNGVAEESKKINYSSKLGSNILNTYRLKVPLREPNPRISTNWGLKPWLFTWLFGEPQAHIQITRINNTLLIGMPCDFSGELMVPLDAYAKTKGLNLIITSFNGTYIGYVADDKHFDKDLYETTTMAWFGSQNGAYFSEIVRDIIKKEIAY